MNSMPSALPIEAWLGWSAKSTGGRTWRRPSGTSLIEKKRLFGERIVRSLPMPASVRELLLSLELPLAVVSTSFRLEVEPALVASGVRDRLGALICGDDVQNFKPHPEPYLTAASRLGVARPLVVEDSDTGAAAGQAAGFHVVRVANANQTAERVRAALNKSSSG